MSQTRIKTIVLNYDYQPITLFVFNDMYVYYT